MGKTPKDNEIAVGRLLGWARSLFRSCSPNNAEGNTLILSGVRNPVTYQERGEFSERLRSEDPIAKLLRYEDRASSIRKAELDLEYLPELAPVIRCLGEALCKSVVRGDFHQAGALHNLEFTLWVALRAIAYINENQNHWSDWSGLPPNDVEDGSEGVERQFWQLTWLRTTFRCVLCMPLGYLVSETEFRGSKPGAPIWSPSEEDMVAYVESWGDAAVTKAKRFIAPREVSHAAYMRLFRHAPDEVPMLALAEADFFSDRPNVQNPIWKAYRRALQHILAGNRHLALPFWWAYAVNHEFIAEPDFAQWKTVLHCKNGFSFNTDPDMAGTSNADETKDVLSVAADSGARRRSSTIERASAVARDQFDLGAFTANTGGCVYQGFGGRTLLVVPRFWQLLCARVERRGLTPDRLQNAFAEAGLIEIYETASPDLSFAIIKPGTKKRLGKCRAIPLSEKGRQALFPGGVPFGDNPDLVAMPVREPK